MFVTGEKTVTLLEVIRVQLQELSVARKHILLKHFAHKKLNTEVKC